MNNKRVMKLATGGKRFVAGLIDRVPIFILSYIVARNAIQNAIYYIMYNMPYNLYGLGGYSDIKKVENAGFYNLALIVLLIIEIYFYTKGQSIGKAIFGLRVVDNKTGMPLSTGRMLLREFLARGASTGVFLLGYIWILVDDQNRSWHDKICDSYVVDERATAIANSMRESVHDVAAAINQGTQAVQPGAPQNDFMRAAEQASAAPTAPTAPTAPAAPAPAANNDPDPSNPFTKHFVDAAPAPSEPTSSYAEPDQAAPEPVIETIDTGFELKEPEPIIPITEEEIFATGEEVAEPETVSSDDEYFAPSEKSLEEQLAALGLAMPPKDEE